MISRLDQPADFQRVLASPMLSRSTHFALHHLALAPLPARKPFDKGVTQVVIPVLTTDLSTGVEFVHRAPVDDLTAHHWLGYVIPKRHAKRSVTRNLFKRHIRSLFAQHASALPVGQWVVRLRTPFAVAQFPSARSDALAAAARAEIDILLARAHVGGNAA